MARRKSLPQRPPLSRQRVIGAALEIVDKEGLPGLTMRALGRALGVDPMAVYYHLPNKDAVLDGVVEAVWSELLLPERSSAPWQTYLKEIARAMRHTLRQHPNALPIMVMRPNLSLAGLRLTDKTLGVLRQAGLSTTAAVEFVNAASEFLLGHALVESQQQQGQDAANIVTAARNAHQQHPLPHLIRALDEVDFSTLTMDRIFEAGLEVLVQGLQATAKLPGRSPHPK